MFHYLRFTEDQMVWVRKITVLIFYLNNLNDVRKSITSAKRAMMRNGY